MLKLTKSEIHFKGVNWGGHLYSKVDMMLIQENK